MTTLKIGPERSEAIDFSIPFIETGITIIVLIKKGVISATAFLGESLSMNNYRELETIQYYNSQKATFYIHVN